MTTQARRVQLLIDRLARVLDTRPTSAAAAAALRELQHALDFAPRHLHGSGAWCQHREHALHTYAHRLSRPCSGAA